MTTKAKAKGKQAKAKAERQRKQKARRAKRLKQKLNNEASVFVDGVNHYRQLKQMRPQAWQGELPVDVAVFDDRALASLSPEEAADAQAVRQALALIAKNEGQQAEDAVAQIGRKSPLSQWRMLVRGLHRWLEDDLESASKSWSRLDTQRRPYRIAAALTLAHREDIAELADTDPKNQQAALKNLSTSGQLAETVKTEPDATLLDAAKNIRRCRIDRIAIKYATAGVQQKTPAENESSEPVPLSKTVLDFLKDFSNGFGPHEPGLVQALGNAALDIAVGQTDGSIIKQAVRVFPGPDHDPKNLLRRYFYEEGFEDGGLEARGHLLRYLESLPKLDAIPDTLKRALIGVAKLNMAMEDILEYQEQSGIWNYGFEHFDWEASKANIDDAFDQSIEAYPAHREAHVEHTRWIRYLLDQEDIPKEEKKALELRLLNAMHTWSESLPEDATPRLFLVDALLENEQLEQAQPHVDWLISSRQDSPLIRALPWRLKLLEATQLCRRKSNLDKVDGVLEQAGALWPDWLGKRWYHYFSAALALRCNDDYRYDQLRNQICDEFKIERNSVADACMMLGAAQRMRVPAAEIKPLRSVVNDLAGQVDQIDFKELLDAGKFFREMGISKFSYPAFRMHGSKFGKEFLARLESKPAITSKHLENENFLATLTWCAQSGFWKSRSEPGFPVFLMKYIKDSIWIEAAWVASTVIARWISRRDYTSVIANLNSAADKQVDAYQQYWLRDLATKLDEKIKQQSETFGGIGMMRRMMEQMMGSSETCDCAECRAARGEI